MPGPLTVRLLAALAGDEQYHRNELAGASGPVLLSAHARLTHQIHESAEKEYYSTDVERTRDLRAQRDLVAAEILRRMGEDQ